MKTLIFLLASSSLWAQEGLDYRTLTNRFVTTVKEAQVEGQFLQIKEVKDCIKLHEITKEDLSDEAKVRDKQRKGAECVRGKLSTVPEAKLKELEKNLGLETFGVIKSKDAQEIINYFSKRLEKALYGANPDGSPLRLKDQKIVDQKVFVDLYETQVGKNILLEISQYCMNRLDSGAGSGDPKQRFKDISKLGEGDLKINLTSYKDDQDLSTVKPDSDIYKDFMDTVVDKGSLANDEEAKKKLNGIFSNCLAAIPIMCARYRPECQSPDPNKPAPSPQCPSDPQVGQHSCHVEARLKGYRVNLMALQKTKAQFEDKNMYLGGGRELGAKDRYSADQARDGETLDDLTSLTTAEVAKIYDNKEMKAEITKIDKAKCDENPEDKNCEAYFYSEKEELKFANAAIGYNAATELEKAKLKALEGKKKELLEYLNSKAYFDIAARLEKGDLSDTQAVAEANLLFEKQREATYREMENAFKKQTVSGVKEGNTDVAKYGENLQNKGKSFQQLMLFNNVVTSYLSMQRVKKDGSREDAGSNVKALKRELQSSKKADETQQLQYFQTYSQSESQIKNGESPLVDLKFLNSVLGEVPKEAVK